MRYITEAVQSAETMATYMGATQARQIAYAVPKAGRGHNEPVAIVENASLVNQRIRRTTVGQLAAKGESLNIGRPALILVGSLLQSSNQSQRVLHRGNENAVHATPVNNCAHQETGERRLLMEVYTQGP